MRARPWDRLQRDAPDRIRHTPCLLGRIDAEDAAVQKVDATKPGKVGLDRAHCAEGQQRVRSPGQADRRERVQSPVEERVVGVPVRVLEHGVHGTPFFYCQFSYRFRAEVGTASRSHEAELREPAVARVELCGDVVLASIDAPVRDDVLLERRQSPTQHHVDGAAGAQDALRWPGILRQCKGLHSPADPVVE